MAAIEQRFDRTAILDDTVTVGYDGAVIQIARTQESKVDVKSQVVSLQAERALEYSATDVAHEHLLPSFTLLHVMRLKLELVECVFLGGCNFRRITTHFHRDPASVLRRLSIPPSEIQNIHFQLEHVDYYQIDVF